MWGSGAWQDYVSQYSGEMYAAQKALISRPHRSGYKHDEKGEVIWAGGMPVLNEEGNEEDNRLCAALDNAERAYASAKRYRDALFPDKCAERAIFARLKEPKDAFVAGNREPLTKSYLAQFGMDVKAKKRRGLIFCGNVGTGKTYIAAGIAQGLCFAGVGCKYILMPELLESIHRATLYKSKKTVRSVIREAFNKSFVVLDEVGRALTACNTAALFEICDCLWDGNYSYIIISNKTVADFMNNIDAACLDRLTGTFVSFEGESWRNTGATGKKSADAQQKFALFG